MRNIVYILSSILLLLVFSAENCAAQIGNPPKQLTPANGSNGIPGPETGSYIMTWAKLPNAVSYQWVNSNNHLCFKGCGGDTRYGQTADTNAIVYVIRNNEWRYWIVRAFLPNGDTTISSPIFSFLPTKSGEDPPIFTITPNPSKDYIIVGIDWFTNPTVEKVSYTVIDLCGCILVTNKEFTLVQNQFIRNEKHQLELQPLNPGIYLIILTINDGKQFNLKVIIQ